jgi:hypothetical protein
LANPCGTGNSAATDIAMQCTLPSPVTPIDIAASADPHNISSAAGSLFRSATKARMLPAIKVIACIFTASEKTVARLDK